MIKVQFTATVFDPDTEETFTGWVDPDWNMFELRSESSDVRTYEFRFMQDAMVFIDETIGAVESTNERGNYYAEDSRINRETGEHWNYAAHVEDL